MSVGAAKEGRHRRGVHVSRVQGFGHRAGNITLTDGMALQLA